jgi:hypothetical protein
MSPEDYCLLRLSVDCYLCHAQLLFCGLLGYYYHYYHHHYDDDMILDVVQSLLGGNAGLHLKPLSGQFIILLGSLSSFLLYEFNLLRYSYDVDLLIIFMLLIYLSTAPLEMLKTKKEAYSMIVEDANPDSNAYAEAAYQLNKVTMELDKLYSLMQTVRSHYFHP